MVFLIIFLIVVTLICTVSVGFFLFENGGMISDQTLEDYLDRLSNNFSVYHSEYCHSIKPEYPAKVSRDIQKSPSVFGLIFPYYIEYVGAIPVWSKSKPRIDAMFATAPKSDWKRKKLGLE